MIVPAQVAVPSAIRALERLGPLAVDHLEPALGPDALTGGG